MNNFANEEKYFAQFNYPETKRHKAIHEKLLGKVSGIITQINEGKDVNFIEVLTFRKDWLQTHILLEDKQYGPFLNKHGIR